MYAVSQLIKKSVEMYQDSVTFGDPNLRYLADAVERSLASLELEDDLYRLSRKANMLWMQMRKAQSQKSKQYAKEKLTRLLSSYKQSVHRALMKSEKEDEESVRSGSSGREPKLGFFLIEAR